MLDYLAAIERESNRLHAAVGEAAPESPVPSCPGWTASDLTWHFAKVQHFWAGIVERLATDPGDVEEPVRPGHGDLESFAQEQTRRLLGALEQRSPADVCWSWHDGGNNVAWVTRRQAHEALIHRVDAQQTIGSVTAPDEELATDGVDEVLAVSMDATDIPEWSHFDSIDTAVRLVVGDRYWDLDLGWFRGQSPASGNRYDEEAIQLRSGGSKPSTVIQGSGAAMDLWLWGRGPSEPLTVEGDANLLKFVRAAAVAATQ